MNKYVCSSSWANKKENRSLFSPLPQFSKALSEVYFPKYDILDGGVFERVTKLSRGIYKQIIDNPYYLPDERVAYTICIALGLSLGECSELLSLAGYSIYPLNANDDYRELLVKFVVNDNHNIAKCNETLKKNGFDDKNLLLGTLTKCNDLSLNV